MQSVSGDGALGVPPSAPLPAHLASQLAAWPSLRALPLQPDLLLRAGLLPRMQDMARDITAHLQLMQERRKQASLLQTPAQRAAEAAGARTPTQLADAHQYDVLHSCLMDVTSKMRDVERVMQQQAVPSVAPQFGDGASPPAARPQGDHDMPSSNGADTAQAASHTRNNELTPQQQQAQAQRAWALQQQQQQQRAAAAAASQYVQAAPAAAQPASSSSVSSPSTHVVSSPVVAPPATPHVSWEWLLPEGRRKLPSARYVKERTLRKTLMGKVVLYWDTQTKQRVAIKISNKELLRTGRTTSGNRVAESPLEELKVLRLLSRRNDDGTAPPIIHPGQNYVVQLLDECEDEFDVWTVLEFCGKGELFDIVCASHRFDENRARTTFIQLAQGVAYMHAHLICHLDLSLENMLVDDNDVGKICDFGLCRSMELDATRHLVPFKAIASNKPGKTGYMAPELFAGHAFYGHLCDIWGMGIMLFIMLTGVPPYQLPTLSDQRFKLIYEGRLETLLQAWQMSQIMSPLAKDLLSRMLCPPERRMNIQQVLAHPWVTGLTDNRQAQQAPAQPQHK